MLWRSFTVQPCQRSVKNQSKQHCEGHIPQNTAIRKSPDDAHSVRVPFGLVIDRLMFSQQPKRLRLAQLIYECRLSVKMPLRINSQCQYRS